MLRAVINVNTRQFWVEQGSKIHCDRLKGEEGASIEFPIIGHFEDFKAKGKVKATILKHYLGDKKVVFYKTQRNGDTHRKGSRARLTMIRIDEIVGGNK